MAFKLKWPVPSDKIIQHFLQNQDYWKDYTYTDNSGQSQPLPGNDGVSLEALFKGEVKACASGTVKAIENPGDVRPNGNTITLEHTDGNDTYQTIYCHLFEIKVSVGQTIAEGDVIATSDSTGSVIGANLKLIVKKIGATDAGETTYTTPDGHTVTLLNDTVDPADYLDPAPRERFAQPANQVITFNDNLNIRRGPGTQYGIIYTAPKGDKLEVLGIHKASGWYQIRHNERTGWGHPDFIDNAGDPSAIPEVEFTINVPVFKPNHPLRGIHDGDPRNPNVLSGTDWMLQNNQRGWSVDTIYCMSADNLEKTYPMGFGHHHNTDYSAAEAAGVRVILRWNFHFAKSDGGGGTFGDPQNDERLAEWIARGIKQSKGVWGHIVGNEPNRAGENHDFVDNDHIGTPIRPQRIANMVKRVKALVGPEHRVAPPAIDGTNTQSFLKYGQEIDIPNHYWSAIIDALDVGDVDWIALHGYSRGSNDRPENDAKFQNYPLDWQFFGFRMWEPFADILRDKDPEWERLPIVITETNHLKVGGNWNAHNQDGWDNNDAATNFIRSAYEYIRQWNNKPNDQYVHGLILYRLSGDHWKIEDKPTLLEALKQSGENPL